MTKLLFSIICGLSFVLFLNTSCTENSRVKNFGGTGSISLPVGHKLVNITWKDDALWYVTRPRRSGETVEEYTFQEESSFGLVEGTYIIKEQ